MHKRRSFLTDRKGELQIEYSYGMNSFWANIQIQVQTFIFIFESYEPHINDEYPIFSPYRLTLQM